MSAGARYLFVSATSLFAADSGSSSANASAGVRWPSARMGLLSVSSTVSCGSRAMEGGDGRAFGRVAADHAVPVLVAAAPPRAVRVGGIRGHARFVAQLGVPGVDACRPGIMAMRRTLAPLPISIRTTCRSSSDRCEYTWPKAQHPSVWLSGQSPI